MFISATNENNNDFCYYFALYNNYVQFYNLSKSTLNF